MLKLTKTQVLLIAAEAQADPRTVVKVYENQTSRGLVQERIARAAEKLGIPKPTKGKSS